MVLVGTGGGTSRTDGDHGAILRVDAFAGNRFGDRRGSDGRWFGSRLLYQVAAWWPESGYGHQKVHRIEGRRAGRRAVSSLARVAAGNPPRGSSWAAGNG